MYHLSAMKKIAPGSCFRAALLSLLVAPQLHAEVTVDNDALGKSLGGWDYNKGKAAEYELSGSKYRTYRPEVTPTPEGGIFISVRVDYCRGVFATNDFATLEMTFSADGTLASVQSSIAIQGKKITSDVVRSGADLGAQSGAIGGAVKMGGDLVANLTEKLSRENLVEAGRVTFPAAIKHNFNKVFQAVQFIAPVKAPMAEQKSPAKPGATLDPRK
jgi:hypothetical protein